jgi:hypothetical protein
MITSSTMPLADDGAVHQAPHGIWSAESMSAPPLGAASAPSARPAIGIHRPGRRRSAGRAGDPVIHEARAVVSATPVMGPQPAVSLPRQSPAGAAAEDPELASLRMVDHALIGLAAVLLAAFFWMCAGKDDLSNPLLILSSWTWHALAVTVIAAMAATVWQLVRRTSWTVRMVFAGILLLNWVLTTLFG